MTCTKRHDFKSLLSEHGVQPTPHRIAIVRSLHHYGRQGADELRKRLTRTIDRVTVFRTLETLEHKGIITASHDIHGPVRYELSDHHTHFIRCVVCGATEELSSCAFKSQEKKALSMSKHFSHITAHTLSFQGMCAACSQS